MLARKDKRVAERFVSNAPISFSLFSTRLWREHPSTTCNHSKDGMCFESKQPLTPGTNLFIRTEKQSVPDSDFNPGAWLRTSTLAEVKWCREWPGALRACYRVGVRYY